MPLKLMKGKRLEIRWIMSSAYVSQSDWRVLAGKNDKACCSVNHEDKSDNVCEEKRGGSENEIASTSTIAR